MVWQVKKKDTGEIYAMKVLKKADIIKQKLIKHINLERDIMVELGNHPFIITLHWAFQTEDKLYFVLDYVNGGSLFHHLRLHKGGFPEERVRFYASEIILALETLHQKNIVYRDLKLENILIDGHGHIRLTDFGLSHKMPKDGNIHSFSGTAAYIAPEIISDAGEGHGKSVDWWSFGVLLHLLFFQEPPFWADDERALLKKIVTDKVQLKNTDKLSPDAISLLRGLLTRDSKYRLGCGPDGTSEDTKPIKSHPFFSPIDWDLLFQKKYTPPWIPELDGILDNKYSDETGTELATPERNLYAVNEKYFKNAFKDFYFSRASYPNALKKPHATDSEKKIMII